MVQIIIPKKVIIHKFPLKLLYRVAGSDTKNINSPCSRKTFKYDCKILLPCHFSFHFLYLKSSLLPLFLRKIYKDNLAAQTNTRKVIIICVCKKRPDLNNQYKLNIKNQFPKQHLQCHFF